jgi:hypothetical protein
MDADYYYATSEQIASGSGFNEPFIWNYLEAPKEIPHPSHLYWMPFASIVATIPQIVLGNGFRIAQISFILLTSFVPLLTAIIAIRLNATREQVWQAGLLAVFSGFFLPFMVTTDTFSLFMILGGVFFFFAAEGSTSDRPGAWFASGLIGGLAHLSRADGVLLIIVAAIVILFSSGSKFRHLLILFLGYLLVMMPWWIHNWVEVGFVMSPNSARALWLVSYDELFSYPVDNLVPQHLWDQGLGSFIEARFDSLLTDLQSLFAVNGLIFLGPLMLIGGYELRQRQIVRIGAFYLISLLLVMSVVFPFAGARGGFFHSSTAVMPILWALAPIGLDKVIRFGVRKRQWDPGSARKVFGTASVVLAGLTTIGLFYFRAIGDDPGNPNWGKSETAYRQVGEWFYEQALEDDLLAITNPPGLYASTKLSSVVIPDGGEEELRAVVRAYEVGWVVLDRNNPGLSALYENPNEIAWLSLQTRLRVKDAEDILIFMVNEEGSNF